MPTTRSGNPTKGAPKYQNETAFRHNKNSKLTKTILAMPISGLCSHCTDQLNWRKTYRKYKPLTQPKKCVRCQQKSIKDAYHVICKPCAEKDKVCAKCLEAKEIVKSNVPTAEELLVQQLQQKCLLSKMTERQRRSYLRKLARDGSAGVKNIEINNSDDEFGFEESEDDFELGPDDVSDDLSE